MAASGLLMIVGGFLSLWFSTTAIDWDSVVSPGDILPAFYRALGRTI